MGIRPEGKFRDELLEELIAKERAIAKGREKLRAETKVARGRIDALEERRDEILDLLDGTAGAQAPLPLTTAKDAARAQTAADLEQGADAILRNAGHGALAKKGLSGPAVARRKGGRRA